MAFDAEPWTPPPPDSAPAVPAAPVRRGETALCVLIAALLLGAMLLPISLAATGDLAHYLLHPR